MDFNNRYVSGSVVNVPESTLTVNQRVHGGKVMTLDNAAGVTVTLPPSKGSGTRYVFIVKTAPTSNSHIIKVANPVDVMNGGIALGADDDAEGATGYSWVAEVGDDTITMNGTATGGKVGNRIECIDYAPGYWSVIAFLVQSGGSEATPFSASV